MSLLTPTPPDAALLEASLATPAPPAPPPPPPPEEVPFPPLYVFPPEPAIAVPEFMPAVTFGYAPPPPVYPVLIAVPSAFKFVADIRPFPPLPPIATWLALPETKDELEPFFP